MNPTGGAGARRGLAQPALHDDLMDAVLAPANMQRAWRRVKSNRGAPGIDGMRSDDFPAYARDHWPEIRPSLSEGCYHPQPVRRVSIPKSEAANARWVSRTLSIGSSSRPLRKH